ncbi:TniQ family protein [Streptomyces sp. NBC_01754]|uniref:TniQ family protein n=1 Tax=Streptomyces sp. NBC_01754 TaxID=2975930 RepID=UPI002DD9DEB6|nr:TniQ family protein [Streptomyces sp. NBC_01754]WSC93956.1 TniQ family protein [Streptomyces sp. NBC_01754]
MNRKRPLPRSLDPLPDETLIGFVLRLAHRLGTTPGEIAVRTGLAPQGRPGLPTRLPLGFLHHLSGGHLTDFAHTTHLTPGEVEGLLLAPLGKRYGPLNPVLTPRSTPARMIYDNPWILTRSTRYCPLCLAGDGDAIQALHGGAWKRIWRLPVAFLCLRHRRLLQHECPGCKTPAQSVRTANAIARLTDDTLHPTQCRFTPRPVSQQQPETACAADLTRPDPHPTPDTATMSVLLRVQQQLTDLLTASGPETAMSAGSPVPVAHYFADLRATVAMIFRTWPVARDYASTPCLAAALDAEYAFRAAQAEPLLNTPGKKKTSKPYTVPPTEGLAAGAALDLAVKLLDTHDPVDARRRLAPLVQRLRGADLALSTWLRRPSWISASLREAVMDLPAGRGAAT